MKKIFSYILLTAFCLTNNYLGVNCASAADSFYKGSVEIDEHGSPKEKEGYFTNEYVKIKPNNKIEMTVAQVLNGAVAQEGDEFFAEVTTDVKGGSGVLLPVGTIAHGKIKQIEAPKRLGRDGYMEISFDYLVTPDGREIPIEGNMSSKLNNVKGTAKVVAEDTGHVLAGGIVGGSVALNMLGYAGAVASNGYTILGGAAVGGVIALGISLIRKGNHALIAPGDEIRVQIKTDDALPVISKEALKVDDLVFPGLNVNITRVTKEKDPFGNDNTLTLDLIIQNSSQRSFAPYDIALQDDLNKSYSPSVFAARNNSIGFTRINKNSTVSGSLSFTVDHPKRQHWLVFYDQYKRVPVARYSLNNVVPVEETKKERKKREKKERRSDEPVFTL